MAEIEYAEIPKSSRGQTFRVTTKPVIVTSGIWDEMKQPVKPEKPESSDGKTQKHVRYFQGKLDISGKAEQNLLSPDHEEDREI